MRAFELYEDVFRSSSPCVPLVIMRVSGKTSDEVQNVCVAHSWSEKRGMNDSAALAALKSLGLDYKSRYDLLYYETESKEPILTDTGFKDRHPRTLNMLLKVIPDGRFIVMVRRHAVAIVDGVLFDDANVGRKHRVQSVYEVIG